MNLPEKGTLLLLGTQSALLTNDAGDAYVLEPKRNNVLALKGPTSPLARLVSELGFTASEHLRGIFLTVKGIPHVLFHGHPLSLSLHSDLSADAPAFGALGGEAQDVLTPASCDQICSNNCFCLPSLPESS